MLIPARLSRDEVARDAVTGESSRFRETDCSEEQAVAQTDCGDLKSSSLRDSQRGIALSPAHMELRRELP